MNHLVDTSVWIDYLNSAPSPAAAWLTETLARGPCGLTEPVSMEVLAGLSSRGATRFERFSDTLDMAPVSPELDYRFAADICREVRRAGRTIRNLNGCLIAAVCLRSDLEVVHKDADFEVIAEVFPLQQLSLR